MNSTTQLYARGEKNKTPDTVGIKKKKEKEKIVCPPFSATSDPCIGEEITTISVCMIDSAEKSTGDFDEDETIRA